MESSDMIRDRYVVAVATREKPGLIVGYLKRGGDPFGRPWNWDRDPWFASRATTFGDADRVREMCEKLPEFSRLTLKVCTFVLSVS